LSLYHYAATLIRVLDGDTIEADLHLGFDVTMRRKFRLLGINAPELKTGEGQAAKQALIDRLAGATIEIQSHKDRTEKYGRYLATVWAIMPGDGARLDVNQYMLVAGFAKPY
jgi:micrococcal nuclease